MRSRFRLLAAAVALAAASCSKEVRPAPDLILVSVDTLRADRLPFYGAERDTGGNAAEAFSPAWLAAQGTVFETCWSAAGLTLPSLGNFWTGLPPLEHGTVTNESPVLAPSRLAALRPNRFEAAHALLANASLAPGCGLERGFDSYGLKLKDKERLIPSLLLERTAAAVRDRKRLLAWAHFMAPHQPYAPEHSPYAEPPAWSADNEFLFGLHRQGGVEEGMREQVRALYDGEVRQASEYVRELLAGLDAQYRAAGRGGLLENAIVVFFSDHGEELGDRHGYFMHAKSLYSGVIRVPLVIAGSGWPAGERRAQPLALGEVLPLVLAGSAPVSEYFFAAWHGAFYSARDQRWTLVHNPTGDGAGPSEPPQDGAYPYPVVGLFDRSTDPAEQRDLSAEHPEEAARLLRALGMWYAGLAFLDATARITDPKVLEQLGYGGLSGAPSRFPPLPAAPWPPVPTQR